MIGGASDSICPSMLLGSLHLDVSNNKHSMLIVVATYRYQSGWVTYEKTYPMVKRVVCLRYAGKDGGCCSHNGA